MNMNHLEFGEQGEQLAADYLQKQGYQLLARRFRTKIGEIDIIAQKGGTIVFVEVKTRSSFFYGTPAQAVNRRKQSKIINVALNYLNYIKSHNTPIRFDILEVTNSGHGMAVSNHISNAFGR